MTSTGPGPVSKESNNSLLHDKIFLHNRKLSGSSLSGVSNSSLDSSDANLLDLIGDINLNAPDDDRSMPLIECITVAKEECGPVQPPLQVNAATGRENSQVGFDVTDSANDKPDQPTSSQNVLPKKKLSIPPASPLSSAQLEDLHFCPCAVGIASMISSMSES